MSDRTAALIAAKDAIASEVHRTNHGLGADDCEAFARFLVFGHPDNNPTVLSDPSLLDAPKPTESDTLVPKSDD